MEPTDVLVVGAGPTGRALTKHLRDANRTVTVVDADGRDDAHRGLAGDLLLTDDGRAAGAQVLEGVGERTLLRARAVVLATGGVHGLYPDGPDHAVGSGLVLAQRAGATVHPNLKWPDGDAPELAAGVTTDDAGRTAVPGLYAAGTLAGGVDPRHVAEAILADLADAPDDAPKVGSVHLGSDIDSPLPEGFTRVKLDRLRELMHHHLGPDGPRDLDKARSHLHRLKGEADAFGRARLDPDLWSFRFATEAAILLAKHADTS